MSQVTSAARYVNELDENDFKILKVCISSLKHHEVLTRNEIVNYSKLHPDIVDFAISNLVKKKILTKTSNSKGYKMLSVGLDIYALKILVDKNVIVAVGRPIGIGKESDVYEAFTQKSNDYENQNIVALKFYRMGRTSFTDTKRKRDIEYKNPHSWLLLNVEAAKKEFDVLQSLQNSGVRIPNPIYRALHCLILDKIEGTRLSDIHVLHAPDLIYPKIIEQIKACYKHGIINCDTSEYNILIDSNEEVFLIDWVQAVTTDHKNASFYLERDVKNITKFFNRKFDLNYDYLIEIKKII